MYPPMNNTYPLSGLKDPEGQVVYAGRRPYSAHTSCAAFVTWCCCFPIGLFALIYGMKAWTLSMMGNTIEAERHGKISKRLSIAGVVIGIILVAIFIAVYAWSFYRLQTFMAGQKTDQMIIPGTNYGSQGNHYGSQGNNYG